MTSCAEWRFLLQRGGSRRTTSRERGPGRVDRRRGRQREVLPGENLLCRA